ncbi:MAG: exonuclease domain-containing protein [Campylobacterota bacterium]|nr:exonuclease domain-containing protein [Campylobacterota bacterium]
MALYILFDTETTGNQERDRIIQIGGMIVRGKTEIEVYDELCSSDVPISTEAMEVHNITPDILIDKPLFTQTDFYQKVNEYNQKENYLIAHNIAFDLGMMEKEGFINHYTLIDTVRCAKHLFPDMPYHRLQYLRYALELYRSESQEAERLEVTIKAHDAIGDVLVMKLLLSRLVAEVKRQFPDSDIMQKLAELTKTPVLMKLFKFGKYRGREIEEVANEDAGYIKWMRKNLDLDEDMVYTLEYYLD